MYTQDTLVQWKQWIHLGMAVPTLWVLGFAVFIIVLRGAALGLDEDDPVNTTCHNHTWTICPQTKTCKCENSIFNIVSCHEVAEEFEVTMLFGYCMMLSKDQTETVVGACPFNFKIRYMQSLTIPSHPSELDTVVCEFTKRTGQLCGQCVTVCGWDLSLPSTPIYYPQCVNCSTSNWAKYLTVSLLPTTVFFLGAVARAGAHT